MPNTRMSHVLFGNTSTRVEKPVMLVHLPFEIRSGLADFIPVTFLLHATHSWAWEFDT